MEWAVVAISLLAAGCLEPRSDHCADGRTCSSGTTCDDANHLCVPPAQTEACLGRIDGNACSFLIEVGVDFGVCNGGTCVPTTWTPTVVIGSGAGQLGCPHDLAHDGVGHFYIADTDND